MGFVVLHINKASGNDAAMTAHIERTIDPKNADKERTHLNEQLVEYPDGVENRTAAIQHRLDTAGLTRKIGTNQVRALRIMLSGTPEDMARIEAAEKLGEWCEDSMRWLRDTFGAENVVSADLHRDEKTPHIHATIVPIVSGERRTKPSNKPPDPNKRTHRKKPANTVRLCADDVMTRKNLERFQDTYAEAMEKYGLERGIRGSEARHITNLEYYRNIEANKQALEDEIEDLQETKEVRRQAVMELEQQEQQARSRTEQATVEKQQAETELVGKQSELRQVKGELKTEKFKGSMADAGSALMYSVSSALGTSKVKRQQQEIEALRSENEGQKQEITRLSQTIAGERQEHTKTTDGLRAELDKIYDLLPDTKALVRMGEYCREIGFTADMVKQLVGMQPVRFSGRLYSHEFTQRFETTNSEARLERDPKRPGLFNLLIDGTSIIQWFRQKKQEFLKAIGINIKPKAEIDQNRGKGIGR
jgi:hypothetical protein